MLSSHIIQVNDPIFKYENIERTELGDEFAGYSADGSVENAVLSCFWFVGDAADAEVGEISNDLLENWSESLLFEHATLSDVVVEK